MPWDDPVHGEGAHLGPKTTHHGLGQEGSRGVPEAVGSGSGGGGGGGLGRPSVGAPGGRILSTQSFKKMAVGECH